MMSTKKIIHSFWIPFFVIAMIAGCSSSGLGTSLGVAEEFQNDDGEGVYRVTASSFAGKYRIGPPPEEIDNLQPVEVEVEITVGRTPGKLHLEFDAPEGETPLVMDVQGGETVTGSGIGLISKERVLINLNAFKVGAGQVSMTIKFKKIGS